MVGGVWTGESLTECPLQCLFLQAWYFLFCIWFPPYSPTDEKSFSNILNVQAAPPPPSSAAARPNLATKVAGQRGYSVGFLLLFFHWYVRCKPPLPPWKPAPAVESAGGGPDDCRWQPPRVTTEPAEKGRGSGAAARLAQHVVLTIPAVSPDPVETERTRRTRMKTKEREKERQILLKTMALFPGLDDELDNPLWCLGLTFRCTPYESFGIWSVIFFYSTIVVVTMIHSLLNNARSRTIMTSPSRNHPIHGRRPPSSHNYDSDLRMLCLLLVYFFTFAAGCLVWVLGGVRYVHPLQSCPIQLWVRQY